MLNADKYTRIIRELRYTHATISQIILEAPCVPDISVIALFCPRIAAYQDEILAIQLQMLQLKFAHLFYTFLIECAILITSYRQPTIIMFIMFEQIYWKSDKTSNWS